MLLSSLHDPILSWVVSKHHFWDDYGVGTRLTGYTKYLCLKSIGSVRE